MNLDKKIEDLIRRQRELQAEIRAQLQHSPPDTEFVKCLKRLELRHKARILELTVIPSGARFKSDAMGTAPHLDIQ